MTSDNKSPKGASRAAAAQALFQVLEQGRSLSTALPSAQAHVANADKGWVQAVCFEVLRELPRYEWLLKQLLDKPLKKKVRVIHSLLLVGICQFRAFGTPAHAVLAETVEASKLLKHKALTGLVNGVLRNYQRQQAALEHQVTQQFTDADCFPRWLREAIIESWPEDSALVFSAAQQRPPLWLRINTHKITPEAYLDMMQAQELDFVQHRELKSAVMLTKAIDVRTLPHFAEGFVSVQDISAQWAAHLLNARDEHRILDACAAPGGKTAHIFELAPRARIDAIEVEETRVARMQENFTRLGVTAHIHCADMLDTARWWDGYTYDRILLDAPCSATGVIRRHPDIKWLRQATDIEALQQLQAEILEQSWQLLAPQGRLLYATCSILPAENEAQITRFLASHADASRIHESRFTNIHPRHGQILPGEDGGDGFYYALLEKSSSAGQ